MEAQRWAELALVAARARGERPTELRALNYQGAIALRHGDVDEAEQRFGDALNLARAVRDHAAQARCLNNLGIIASLKGDAEAALATTQASAESLADIERDFAAVLQLSGDASGADAARQRAITLYQRLGAKKAAQDLGQW